MSRLVILLYSVAIIVMLARLIVATMVSIPFVVVAALLETLADKLNKSL